MPFEETFAINVRAAGKAIQDAELAIGQAEAKEKQIYAAKMMEAEHEKDCKTAAAQMRYADASEEVYNARLERGVAKGMLAAAKAELRSCEIEFDKWRSDQASQRLEKRSYS